MMLVAPERMLIGGRAWPNMGLRVSNNGVVEAVAPLSTLGTPTHPLPGEMLVPGLVDVRADALGAIATDVVKGHKPSYVLTESMAAKLRCGITAVGMPIEAPSSEGAASAVVQLLRDCAQLVGLRIALLYTCAIAPRGSSTSLEGHGAPRASLDACILGFEHFVAQILRLRAPLLSWGLHAPLGSLAPIDALTGLRVRLGHLPCLIDLSDAPRGSSGGRQPIQWLAEHGLLDACASVCVGPQNHCSQKDAAVLQQSGSTLVHGARTVNALLTSNGFDALASFNDKGPSVWPQSICHKKAGGRHGQRLLRAATYGGMRSLGLRGGRLQQGTWADYYTISLEELARTTNVPSQWPPEDAWAIALSLSMGRLTAVRTHVGGHTVGHRS